MKLATSAVTGVDINYIIDEHIMKLVEYQGTHDTHLQRLGLDRAIQNWTVWLDIEHAIEGKNLARIRALFTSELFCVIMIQSGLTHKALRCIKAMDEYGIFKNVIAEKICEHLEVRSFSIF